MTSENKRDVNLKKIKTAARITLFLFLMLVINYVIVFFAKDRSVGGWRTWESFYSQEPDTIDVHFVGDSRVFWNINPAPVWNEYGIASFDLAAAGQPAILSYYSIKEALKTQHPQAVVLETSATDHDDELLDPLDNSKYFAGMKMSANKIDLIASAMKHDPEKLLQSLLILPVFRSKLFEFSKDCLIAEKNLRYPQTKKAGYKGANELFFYGSKDKDEIEYDDTKYSERHIEYLEKIEALCKENGVELLFTCTPNLAGSYQTAIDTYVKEHGTRYLNCIEMADDIGIIHQEFVDDEHLNFIGSEKASLYIGKYLIETMGVKGHDKSDPRYMSWQENLAYSNQMHNDYGLSETNGLGTYFDCFPDENYILFITLKGEYKAQDQGQRDILHQFYINDESYDLGGTWVIDGNDIIYYYVPGYSDDSWKTKASYRTLCIKDGEVYVDNMCYTVKDEDGGTIDSGLEVIVFDKLAGHVVDAVCFNADKDYLIERSDIKHVYYEWY